MRHPESVSLGRIALQLGLFDQPTLARLLKEAEAADQPLDVYLKQQNLLDTARLEQLRREAQRTVRLGADRVHILQCPSCGAGYRVVHFDPARKYTCKKCSGTLQLKKAPSDTTVRKAAEYETPVPPDVRQALLQPGNDLGKYVLLDPVGKGGMGTVFKAWEKGLGRYVAVKFLESATGDDLKRFLREAQIVARLDHPNIVRVYEISNFQGRPYIAMQFIQGRTLERLQVPIRRACELIRDVALAVEYAHKRGVVHRDIKPQNLMLDDDGQVYITDFGLAKEFKGQGVSTSGLIVGTPAYMAPEQASGARRIDGRADVYSLGAVLYRMVTGRVPFHGRTAIETTVMVVNEDPIDPVKLNPKVDRDLRTLILKAMEKDPNRRYASAKELADDLKRYLSGEPIVARPASLGYRLAKRLRKQWPLLAAAAVALLVTAGTATYLVVQRSARAAEFRRLVAAGDERLGRNDYDRAKVEYEKALHLDPSDPAVRERLKECERLIEEREARLQQERRRLQEERQRAEREKEAQAQAFKKFAAIQAKLDETRRDLYVKGARLAESFRSLERLLPELDEAARLAPRDPQAEYLRGRVHDFRGDTDAALAAYTRALELDPTHVLSLVYRGRLYQTISVYAWLEQIDRLAGSFLKISGTWTQRQREQWIALAQQDLRRAKELGGLSERRDQAVAEAYRLLVENEFQAAIRYADEALGEFADEELHVVRGLAYWSIHDVQNALDAYDRALKMRVNFFQVRLLRGVTLMSVGQWRDAEHDLNVAIEINPTFFYAYLARALVMGMQRKVDQTFSDLDEAVRLRPNSPTPYLARAMALAYLKFAVRTALQDCNRAVELNPNLADAYALRGFMYAMQSEGARARADWEKAVALEPGYEPVLRPQLERLPR